MIWNNVYLGLFYTFIYVILFIIKRPFPLYVAIDFAYLQGYARKDSKTLFFQKGIFGWFQLIQVVFIIRGLVIAGITVFLLRKYGIDGYGDMLIYKRVASWVFSGIVMGMFFYINVIVQKYTNRMQEKQEEKLTEQDIVAE